MKNIQEENNRLESLPPLREVIGRYKLSADKKFGQNFLLDINLTRKIARAAGNLENGSIFEIGPGPGGLTRGLLLEGAQNLFAIEKDTRCLALLEELGKSADGKLTLIKGDALKQNFTRLGPPPRKIVANLPYNIATPLLIGWLKQAGDFQSFTLMFQKEVAERITAQPGSRAYSRLSVLCNWRCETNMLFTLPANAFTPPPKVKSALVQIIPYAHRPDDCKIDDLEKVTAAAFGQRRKMLRRSLKILNVDIKALLSGTDIDPEARAESLTIPEFTLLARRYRHLRDNAQK